MVEVARHDASVDLALEDAAAQLQELRPDPLTAPARKSSLADTPAGGQLLLVEMNDFHLGLLPNELAGVHEGAVPPDRQVDVGAPSGIIPFSSRLKLRQLANTSASEHCRQLYVAKHAQA